VKKGSEKAYNYLSKIRLLDHEILRAEAVRSELESCLLPQGINYEKDKVQKSRSDQMSKVYADIEEKKAEEISLREKKHKLLKDISDTIERLEDDQEKTVLTMYWLGNVRIYDIAAKMNYSISKIYAAMQKGMKDLETYIKD